MILYDFLTSVPVTFRLRSIQIRYVNKKTTLDSRIKFINHQVNILWISLINNCKIGFKYIWENSWWLRFLDVSFSIVRCFIVWTIENFVIFYDRKSNIQKTFTIIFRPSYATNVSLSGFKENRLNVYLGILKRKMTPYLENLHKMHKIEVFLRHNAYAK